MANASTAAAMCNLSRYLREQEIVCLRMEFSANRDTPMGAEWAVVASALAALQAQHFKRCGKCSAGRKGR
ncbi:MAG: hypothetical protein ACLQLH_03410 [Terracidiphilus sp.]